MRQPVLYIESFAITSAVTSHSMENSVGITNVFKMFCFDRVEHNI